jgi:hypothetical protein
VGRLLSSDSVDKGRLAEGKEASHGYAIGGDFTFKYFLAFCQFLGFGFRFSVCFGFGFSFVSVSV